MHNPPLRCVASISGIRGVVGDTLDLPEVIDLAASFGAVLAGGGQVVLGRDSRPTGAMLARAAAAALQAVGCDVVDIGIVPTPTVPIAIRELGAAGGIQISASHNPVEWNALKFFNRDARNIDSDQLGWILGAHRDPPVGMWRRWDGCGRFRTEGQALDWHLRKVLAAVDGRLIRAARPKVVVDCVNGAGAELAPRLLADLGCEVVTLYARSDQPFPRDPEPTAANVKHLGAVVRAVGADVGFVQDPDADRLAIVDETGRYIGEEYTLVLCAAARFAAEAGKDMVACTNLSTSRMLEDVAARHGARVVRAKVGEANVVDAMQKQKALIGGEGNGGVIDPRVVICRDSHIAMALVLELLARAKQPLSEVVRGIPSYAIHKEKVAMDRAAVQSAIPQLRQHPVAHGAEVDDRDGLKLVWRDRWVHLRASGTEPVSRIIAEAPGAIEASDLAERVRSAVGAQVHEGH